MHCNTGGDHLARQGKPHDWLTAESGCLLFIRRAVNQHAHQA